MIIKEIFLILENIKFFKIIIFIYFLLYCILVAAQAFSSCGKQGLSLVEVRRYLIAVVSLVEHGL